jgi:alcohol dehydrogenase (cytochrome c)
MIMRKTWLLATLLAFSPTFAAGQTTEELNNDGKNAENVVTQSMGFDRKSYSPLAQINKSNIKRLVPVWSASLMSDLGELAAPVVYNGVVYAINAKWTIAIDVETGRQLWRTPVQTEPGMTRANTAIYRGAPAIYNGKLYRVTVDNHLVALEMKTGRVLWNKKFADWKEGYHSSGSPIVANGVLISGVAGGESTTRGFIDGWDPETGEKLWRRYTIPAPGEPGSETWPANSDAWRYGGGSVWRSGSYDPQLDLVYFGIGNAEPYDPRPREGRDSLYTDSVLAIRPKTGEIACYYQYTPNDVYDVDSTDETGIYKDFLAGQEVEIYPSRGSNAVPIAFDPTKGLVYAAPWDLPRIQQLAPPHPMVIGENSTGVNARQPKIEPGQVVGYYIAFDPLTGQRKWEVPLTEIPSSAGMLATGGGVVFTGKLTGEFLALDQDSGKTLWQFQTSSSVNSTAITYMHNGRQYVTVASGLGGILAKRAIENVKVPTGGSLWTFALLPE